MIICKGKPCVIVEFNNNITLAGKTVLECEKYFLNHYGEYVITFVTML